MSDRVVPMSKSSDGALRRMIYGVSEATVELVADRISGCRGRPEAVASLLLAIKNEIAVEIVGSTMARGMDAEPRP